MKRYLIQNGTIFDGSGADRFQADLLIENGRIAEIGRFHIPPADCKVIEAAGKYVIPGLVDMHSHADVTMAGCPGMENYLAQGITTLSVGHCGMGSAPIDRYYQHQVLEDRAFHALGADEPDGWDPYNIYVVETEKIRRVAKETLGYEIDWKDFAGYMAHMRKVGIGCNIHPMVSFGTIRLQVMGMDYQRPATAEERTQMCRMLRRELDSGARGVHFSADYCPDCYASHEELLAMAKIAAEYDVLLEAHTQNQTLHCGVEDPSYKCQDGIRLLLDLGMESGARTNVSHLPTNWPTAEMDAACGEAYMYESGKEILAMIEDYRAHGLDVSFDVIPPNCMCILTDSTPELSSLYLAAVTRAGGVTPFCRKLTEPAYRAYIRSCVDAEKFREIGNCFPPYRRFLTEPDGELARRSVVLKAADKTLEGKTFGELMDQWQVDGLELTFRLLMEDAHICVKFQKRYESLEERTDRLYIRHPLAAIGLDSTSANIGYNIAPDDFPMSACPPGNFNAMVDYLKMDIFERFEDTVYKASGRSCEILRLHDRGLLRKGYRADVVILNPDQLASRKNYAEPWTCPAGIDEVFVNGVPAVHEGMLQNCRAGEIL